MSTYLKLKYDPDTHYITGPSDPEHGHGYPTIVAAGVDPMYGPVLSMALEMEGFIRQIFGDDLFKEPFCDCNECTKAREILSVTDATKGSVTR